jgi:hypothetical protein
MNKITLNVKYFTVFLLLSLVQTVAWAQDGGGADIDVKITKDDGNWYAQPWVWIVGGAVFLLLLVALLRGNNNKN